MRGKVFRSSLLLLLSLLLARDSAFAQIPRVDSIEPTQGPIAGATRVTIRGANFTGATITINRTPVTPTVHFDSEIQFVTPSQESGIALIRISKGQDRAFAEFLYVPPRLEQLPPGHITTVAGGRNFFGDGRPATEAMIETAGTLALDSAGNMYIPEAEQGRIRRVRADGVIETFSGTGVNGSAGDGGPATEAQFQFPRGVAVDTFGNLFVADQNNFNVRRIDATTGTITTFAGTGSFGFSGDGGLATQAQFRKPNKVVVAQDGVVYILDSVDHRIRRVGLDGIVSTFAGTGTPGFSGDGGPATEAQFFINQEDGGGLAVDAAGNLYLADTGNGRVRRIDKNTGIISTVGLANSVRAVTVDSSGSIWFAPNVPEGSRIVAVNPSGATLASFGSGDGFSEDGVPASTAPLGFIEGLQIDGNGNILFTELESSRVRRINVQTGLLETAAGMGPRIINETGPATRAILNIAYSDILFLPSGELLVADSGNALVRKVDPQGNISTFAGNGFIGFGSVNPNLGEVGPASEVSIVAQGLELERDGSILITAGALLRLDQEGLIRVVAGRGVQYGFSGDGGPAVDATFRGLQDVAVDQNGNIYVVDTNNNRIRRIDRETSIITTVAGSGPSVPTEGFGQGSSAGMVARQHWPA
ncbi:MAG: IPT/TIG domain-containing protein [Acidobacteria bacterium]|nr:IPT/TIG domain-containing protein [Acidobacteriota bacterium]